MSGPVAPESRLRIAVVGTGAVANDAHLPAWTARADSEVVWAIDIRPEAAQATAGRWGIPRWGTDFGRVLSDTDVDVIDFCTPPLERAAHVVPALEAGKHVLVEKPAAITLDEAHTMARAAARAGRILLVAENWPYASATTRVRTLLGQGTLGDLFLIQGSIESGQWLQPPPPSSYAARLGYAFLVGVHALNVARVLLGEVAEVTAYATPSQIPPGGALIHETDMAIAVRFRSAAVGSFLFTARAHPASLRRTIFRLYGTGGSLEFDVHAGYVDWTARGVRTRHEETNPSMGYAEEVEHFVRCIRGEEAPMTSMADQIKTLEVVLAVYESAMSGHAVSIAS